MRGEHAEGEVARLAQREHGHDEGCASEQARREHREGEALPHRPRPKQVSKGPVSAQQPGMPRKHAENDRGTPRRPTKEAVRTGMVMNQELQLSADRWSICSGRATRGMAEPDIEGRRPAQSALTTRVRANASALTTVESAAHSAMVGRSHAEGGTKLMSSMADPRRSPRRQARRSAAAKDLPRPCSPAMRRSVAQAAKNAAIARLRRMCPRRVEELAGLFQNTATAATPRRGNAGGGGKQQLRESASGKRMYCPLNMKR